MASDLTFSMAAAQSKAEELKVQPYAALSSGDDVLKQRQMSFDRTWTVTVDSPYAGITSVSVNVVPRRSESLGTSNGSASLGFIRVAM